MRNILALSALLLSSAAAAQSADPDARADRVVAAMRPEERTILTHGVMALKLFPGAPDLPAEAGLTPSERAFSVTVNDLMIRTRWARSGHRTGYFKPEASLGIGAYQVTRLLRNPPAIPPEDTSQLLAAVELGAAALFVFSQNFIGIIGSRFTVMEREAIVDSIDHFDGFALTLGFRIFLPSPADAEAR